MSMRTWLSQLLALFLLLSAAHAESPSSYEATNEEPNRSLLARELPARQSLDVADAPEPQDWRRIRLRKGAGLEVRRSVTVGKREVVFGVKGPLMKKKRLGLAIEVRF